MAIVLLSYQRNLFNSRNDDPQAKQRVMSNSLAIAALVGVAILVWVIFLYRKGKLKEDLALLWIAVSIAIILLSTWTGLLVAINQIVGAANVSNVVLAAFVAFLIMVSIFYSVKISTLEKQNKRIAQEIAVTKAASESTDSTSDREQA